MIDLKMVESLYETDWDIKGMADALPAVVAELESARKVVEVSKRFMKCKDYPDYCGRCADSEGGDCRYKLFLDALTAYDNPTQKEV